MAAKKRHRWGVDATADVVQTGKLAVQSIGKFRDRLRQRAARRDLPENMQQLIDDIEAFNPARRAKREQPYHDRLFGYLQGKYGQDVQMEVQRGRERPDIVVWGTVAIEVKGPTGFGELNTIASKILRYKQHWPRIVCVLFDIEDRVHFAGWRKGVEQSHPDVVIIPK